jgi:transcriptional regulator with XRE-family HTH domain
MELREKTETFFGAQVRDARTRRGWSQEELAKRLTAKGVKASQATIAKLEAENKPRAVRLAEAVALADLFEVSLDALLNRSVGVSNDLVYTVRAFLDSVRQAMQQISATAGTLHSRITDLERFDFDGREMVQAETLQATTALMSAMAALAQLSFFDLPPEAASASTLKEAVDTEGAELLATTLALIEGGSAR